MRKLWYLLLFVLCSVSVQGYTVPSVDSVSFNFLDYVIPSIDNVNFSFELENFTEQGPQFDEIIPSAQLNSSETFNFTGNFTSDLDVSISSICGFLDVEVNNASRTYSIFYLADQAQAGTNICSVSLSDGIFNTQSNLFTVNVTIDPSLIADFIIVNGSNLSTVYYSGNTTGLDVAVDWQELLYNVSNMSTINVTAQNPLFNITNNDTQNLDCVCNLTNVSQGLQINVSNFFDMRNSTNITQNNTIFFANVSPNNSCVVFPTWNFVNYNFTLQRNDTALLACGMAVQ